MNRGFDIFCENVRILKETHGLTQKQLAEIMRVGLYSCRKILHGEMPPRMSIEVVFFLAQHFHVHPKELFTASGECKY